MANHYKQTAIKVMPKGSSRLSQPSRPSHDFYKDAGQAQMEARNPPTLSEDVETIRKEADLLIPRSPAVLQLANGLSKRVILPIIFELIQLQASPKVKRAIARIREVWRQEDLIADAVAAEKKRKRKPDGDRRTDSAMGDKDNARETIEAADDDVWNQPHMQSVARHMLAYKQQQLVASETGVLANGLTFVDMQKNATYSGTVYNGGQLNQDFSPFPVYVELSSVEPILSPNQTQPSLKDHAADRPVGHHFVRVEADKLTVQGGVFSVRNRHSEEVISAIAGGYQWQASIRGKFSSVTLLKKDQSQTINGRTVEGPALLAKNFRWRETTWTGLGANQPDENGVGAAFEVTVQKGVRS